MQKQKIVKFVDKFYLNGKINHVVLHSKDNKLSTRFWSADKLLLGELSMSNWNFEDATMGIYNTKRLYGLLGILDDDIKLQLTTSKDKAISLGITDNKIAVNYMLADLNVINVPPALKKIPDFKLKIKINPNFISSFIAGKAALGDETDTFTIITNDTTTKIVIGYSEINSNRVIIPVETDSFEKIDNISFGADLLKEVLTANKDCQSALLEISDEGLARIIFKIDDFSVVYYLVALQNLD